MKTLENVVRSYNAFSPLVEQIRVDIRPLRSRPGTWCASLRFVTTDEVLKYPDANSALDACEPSMEAALASLNALCEMVSFA